MSLELLKPKIFCRKALHVFLTAALMLAGFAAGNPAMAQSAPEKRIAFVVGNAAYKVGPLPTPANDAGLIAQTLQAAGFDVVGARDLDQNSLHDAMRDFISKVNAAGPDAVAFVYLAGYALQYQGDNYFAPVDAEITKAADVPVEALRLSDFTKALAAINNRGSIVVLDGARANPFVANAEPLAGGLALVQPDASQLIAFNATPGTVAPPESGPYGAYAHALAETIRTGGLSLADVFDRTRLRVGELTKGAEVSWDADTFKGPFNFFNRAPTAPVANVPTYDAANIRNRPIRDFDERDAYFAALYRDTLAGYEDFLAAYPNDAMARRVRAIVAARREAITWRETWVADTPPAYWSYLRRYPQGPHVWDARRRLAHLEAALEPPPSFTVITYDVPPPPPTEVVFVERRVLYFDDVDFGYAPPPPVIFLAPPQREFITLAPPPPPVGLYVLPMPAYVPVPAWVEPPAYVEPPHDNIIFQNIHNTVVNNTVINEPAATPPAQQTVPAPATAGAPAGMPMGQKLTGAALAAGAGAAALHVALPPSLQKRVQGPGNARPAPSPQSTTPGALANSRSPAQTPPSIHTLPGATGQPLPKLAGEPAPQIAPTKAETATHALPGADGKALPPASGIPPLKAGNDRSPPEQELALPAEGPRDKSPAQPNPHPDRATKSNGDFGPQEGQRQKPKTAEPRAQQTALAPMRQVGLKPTARPEVLHQQGHQLASAHRASAPKPPKMPKPPKPPKVKKCGGKHGCH